MKASVILTTLFAAFVAAAPAAQPDAEPIEIVEVVNVEARQSTTRVLLARDDQDIAVQANIARNNQRISIRNNFGNLGNPVQANRGNIVSGGGTCRIFSDANGQNLVATLPSNGNSVSFGSLRNLNNGVIVCQ